LFNGQHLLGLSVFLFSDRHDLIVTHGRSDSNAVGDVTSILKLLSNFTTEVIRVLWELDILAGFTIFVHQSDEPILRNIDQGIFLVLDERNVSVVGGRDNIFVLLASEDIVGSEVALGVTVLTSLGGRDSRNLARKALDANVAIIK
jgi:hypothetical protein